MLRIIGNRPRKPLPSEDELQVEAAIQRNRFCKAAGGVVGAIALVVLLGWVIDIPVLKSLHPSWSTMKVNTAICFVFLAIAVATSSDKLRATASLIVAIMSLITLAEYALGTNLGIDELLWSDTSTTGSAPPGRPSLATAAAFLMLAIAIPFSAIRRIELCSLVLSSVVAATSFVSILVYTIEPAALYQLPPFSSVALHTAVCFSVLSVATIFRSHGADAMVMMRDAEDGGGVALRRMIPTTIVPPVVFAIVCGELVQRGSFSAEFAISTLAIFMVVGSLAGLLWTARVVRDVDRDRRAAEASVRRAFESSLVATLVVGSDGRIQASNEIAQTTFGYSREEFAGLEVDRLVPEVSRPMHGKLRADFAAAPTARPMGPDRMLFACRKDGSRFPVEIGLNPVPSSNGLLIVATVIDVTARLEAERAIRENERRLSLVFDATNEAIWDLDLASGKVWWNAAARELIGCNPNESSDYLSWWRERIHPDDRKETAASLLQAINSGQENWSREYRLMCDSGAILYVYDRAAIARGQSGKVVRVVGAIQNRTDAKLAEIRLRESEQRARAMAEQAPMLMWLTEPDGSVSFVNTAWKRFTGVGLEAAQGDQWFDLVNIEDRDRLRTEYAAAREHHDAFVTEFRLRDSRGRYRWILWHSLPWRQRRDEFGGFIGCGVDIDTMKHSLADLIRSNAELEHFAYVASHDLQEPLRMVSSFCQLLEQRYSDRVDDAGREFIHFAVDGAKRMQSLIQDLLQYSRVGRADLELAPVSADIACDVAIRNLAQTIEACGAIVVKKQLPRVIGNASQLTLVFQNLIANACKFKAAAVPRIEIWAETRLGVAHFFVKDNGIGIAPEHSERIFRIFQRLHGRDEYSGSGIGLAIVKRIVDAHGGSVSVTSVLGVGSTFEFSIPSEETDA